MSRRCAVAACPRTAVCKRLCRRHYAQQRRTGDPIARKRSRPVQGSTEPVQLVVLVDADTADRLRWLAERNRVSLTELARRIFQRALARGDMV